MEANKKQVGGTHYKSKFQHWDFVDLIGLTYLPAQVTKYLTRWRKKNGIQDLEKANHFLEKYIENLESAERDLENYCEHFGRENKLDPFDWSICELVINAHKPNLESLRRGSRLIKMLISEQKM